MDKLTLKIKEDANGALKLGENQRYQVLKYLLSLLQNEEIRLGEKFNQEAAILTLQKEMKGKKEALEAFKKGERKDLIAEQEEEIKILSKYLPKMMTEKELTGLIKELITEKQLSDFGQVMREIMPQIKGKADGKMVSEVVKKVLS